MSIDVGNAKGFLKDFRRWEKGEKSSCVLIVERRNLKGLFPVAALRRDRSHPLLVVLQVVRPDSLEVSRLPVVHRHWFLNKEGGMPSLELEHRHLQVIR